MTSFAERNPRVYYAVINRFRKLIATAETRKNTARAERLALSLLRYKLTANTTYGKGIPRDVDPRTKTVR